MIPWMREKFAERKAKWEASRKRSNISSENIGVSDRIPLRKEVSYDSIEIFENESQQDCVNKDVILLKIICYDGRLLNLRLLNTTPIAQVKCQTLTELLLPQKNEQNFSALNYKLLKSTEGMLDLNEFLSIRENNILDQDELLLVKCNNNNDVQRGLVQKGPSQTVIDKVTAERIACGERVQPIGDFNEVVLHCNVRNDIRQLLVSLAKSSAFVIGAGPFAAKIILMFKQRLIRRNDLNILEFVPQFQIQNKMKTASDVQNTWQPKTKILDLSERLSEAHFSNSSSYESTKSKIQALLEIIRIYSYKHLTAKSNFKELIWNMGFSEEEVQDALRNTENDYADAFKWLIRRHDNYNDGLLKDSPILKALLLSPHIQLSFSSPKIFIAYLSILDNYSSINLWLSDAETAGVLGHVLRIYHEEKHILAINQLS